MKDVLDDNYLELTDDFDKLEYLEEAMGVEIVSYGLAPNPTGYCYEIVLEDRYNAYRHSIYHTELIYLCDYAKEGYLYAA